MLVLCSNEKWSCFVYYFEPMDLMMYIGNDLIESVPLDNGRISKPGYVGSIKRCLKVKHVELIEQSAERPEFLVIDNSPKVMQEKKNLQSSYLLR
ncbi:MAG TPA: hypothetical protein VI461_10460 [Chitinophagaceae bacterium]|nr:hypothetical protein [Chitinophagaceae bacterium]